MHTPLSITIATLGLVAMAATASAQTATAAPKPDAARQHQQLRQRIHAGVEAGQLTPAELRRLRARMAGIRQRAQAVRNAGTAPTPELRRVMRRQRLQLDRMIFRLRHNRIIR